MAAHFGLISVCLKSRLQDLTQNPVLLYGASPEQGKTQHRSVLVVAGNASDRPIVLATDLVGLVTDRDYLVWDWFWGLVWSEVAVVERLISWIRRRGRKENRFKNILYAFTTLGGALVMLLQLYISRRLSMSITWIAACVYFAWSPDLTRTGLLVITWVYIHLQSAQSPKFVARHYQAAGELYNLFWGLYTLVYPSMLCTNELSGRVLSECEIKLSNVARNSIENNNIAWIAFTMGQWRRQFAAVSAILRALRGALGFQTLGIVRASGSGDSRPLPDATVPKTALR
ncbi:hypothetical protein B0H14DRAFT_2627056 [Mycena olivaceomarginata]|nr:hypothetical protein B0H14DRAFT_2627056 [Mycena olivaceomarginata]